MARGPGAFVLAPGWRRVADGDGQPAGISVPDAAGFQTHFSDYGGSGMWQGSSESWSNPASKGYRSILRRFEDVQIEHSTPRCIGYFGDEFCPSRFGR
jgi:hypothetical protein